MSNQLLASKVVVVEEEPRIRNVATLPTAIVGMILITQRGPVGVATLVTSFEEYSQIFGGNIANSDAAAQVEAFFANGGSQLYVVRTVHYTDITNAATKTSAQATLDLNTDAVAAQAGAVLGTVVGPFVLAPGDTLVVNPDAVGDETATFDASAAELTSTNTETFALADGNIMTFDVNGVGKSVEFNTGEFVAIGAATAQEIANVINAEVTGVSAADVGGAVVITSDKKGTGALIDNFADGAGTPVATIGFTAASDAGAGDVADITAVTVAEVKTVVEADVVGGSGVTVNNVGGAVQIVSNTTGGASSIAVNATSTADEKMGIDNATHSGVAAGTLATLKVQGKTDGAFGNLLKPVIAPATSGDAGRFNFQVLDTSGLILETFPNVTMDDTDANYVEAVVNDSLNGSELVVVTDLDAATPAPNDRPVDGTFGPLTGGNDGLTSLDDTDFVGSSAGSTGIRALDLVADLTILAVPGRASSAVHNAMITYTEVTRSGSVFAVLDPPAGLSATGIVTYVETTAALLNLSEFGAIYWPRVNILNPSKTIFGNADRITVAPAGHICGVFSRTDNARPGGIYDPPAGTEKGRLFGVLEFEGGQLADTLIEDKRDLVFPKRINPLTTQPGLPLFIDGARTLKGGGNFPTVAERRGVSFIEKSVKLALEDFRQKNNTPTLRGAISRTVEGFLQAQMRFGAFRSTDPAKAFFVDFGDALNPPSQQNIVTGRIGLATPKPTEFIVLRFSQDTRAIEAELAA